ncbi:MAG: transporter [Syntrophobacteraceae bacterium]
MAIRVLGAVLIVLLAAGTGFAAHPLVTDDTGTQGTGKFQVELLYEYERVEGGGVTDTGNSFDFVFTGGLTDTVDLVLGIPLLHVRSKSVDSDDSVFGAGDLGLEVKWRFFERDTFSLALKPGLSIPSGDDEKGLGSGRVGGSLFLIATKDLEPFAIHANVGYGRNENKLDENKDLWHVSLATEYKVIEGIRLVGNVGADASADKATDTPEGFVLGGLIYSATENLDLDIGAKGVFTESADGFALLAGATFRF